MLDKGKKREEWPTWQITFEVWGIREEADIYQPGNKNHLHVLPISPSLAWCVTPTYPFCLTSNGNEWKKPFGRRATVAFRLLLRWTMWSCTSVIRALQFSTDLHIAVDVALLYNEERHWRKSWSLYVTMGIIRIIFGCNLLHFTHF